MNFVLLLPLAELTREFGLRDKIRIGRIVLNILETLDVLLHKALDAVVLRLVLVGVLHNLGRRLETGPTVALLEEVHEVAQEALRPFLGLDLNLQSLVQRILIRCLGNRHELIREVDDRKTAPSAAIRRLNHRLLVACQMELCLELEVHHRLGTRLEIASGDRLVGRKLLHETGVECHALVGLLHRDEALALHADDIGLRGTRLLATLSQNADIDCTGVITQHALQEVEQNGLAVGTTARENLELLRRIAAHEERGHMLDPELADLLIRKHAADELLNLRPAGVFVLLLVGLLVDTRGERNLVFGTTIAESNPETIRLRGHVVHAIIERDQVAVLVRLHREGLIEEELAALLHDIVLELGATEIRADLLKQLLLVQELAERATELGLLVLTLLHLFNALAQHVLDVVALDLPDLRGELALEMDTAIRLLPDVAGVAEPHAVRKARTLVLVTEVGVHDARHIVLRARARRLNQVDDVILADFLVALRVVRLGPEQERPHTETLTVLAEREAVPLLNAVALVELVRAAAGEVKEGVQEIDVDVLQTLTDFLPVLVVRGTHLREIVDVCLDETALLLIERTLTRLRTRRRTARSSRVTASRRTTARRSCRTTPGDAIVGVGDLRVHLVGGFRHRRALLGIRANRELLDEIDAERRLLGVHVHHPTRLAANPRDLVRKTARLLRFLEHPLLTVAKHRLVLDVLPVIRERKPGEELGHARNHRTANGLLNETRSADVGNHDMNARLGAVLFGVDGRACLFHDLDFGLGRDHQELLDLLHVRRQEVDDLLLRVLVLGHVLGVVEVQVHAKLADRGRLFREMQRSLIVFDVLHVKVVEFVHLVLGDEEGPRRSPEGGVRKHTTLAHAVIFEELVEAHSVLLLPTISWRGIHFKRMENGTKTLGETRAEMKFCPDCHNMLYAMVEGQLKCRSCAYSEPIPTVVYEHNLEAKTSARLSINPYIVNDPTLPRFTHMDCFNPECPTYSGTPRDVVGVKEDATNLRWA